MGKAKRLILAASLSAVNQLLSAYGLSDILGVLSTLGPSESGTLGEIARDSTMVEPSAKKKKGNANKKSRKTDF